MTKTMVMKYFTRDFQSLFKECWFVIFSKDGCFKSSEVLFLITCIIGFHNDLLLKHSANILFDQIILSSSKLFCQLVRLNFQSIQAILKIKLPAFAGNFARASFTVYAVEAPSDVRLTSFVKLTTGLAELRTCGSHRIWKTDPDMYRPGVLTGSIDIIQNTIITVYEIESKKAVNTKLWKWTTWFSEVIREILHHNFRES